MGTTSDRSDPGLHDIDPQSGLQAVYLVLSEDERAKGFVEPVRQSYLHEACGGVTTMGQPIAESYARTPEFYTGTYCATCRDHFPVGADGEFVWATEQALRGGPGQKVGTRSDGS